MFNEIVEEKKKYSTKYTRPRNTPELLLEIMHDYDEIKETFESASNSEKANILQTMK